MTMAENIRNLRLLNNMTQEELGRHIGVQKSAIRKYESGMVENIPRASIQKMAELFCVSPSYLMGWEDASPIEQLSEGEAALLELFKRVPKDKQELVIQMIRVALGDN